jgi:hypothetical protein
VCGVREGVQGDSDGPLLLERLQAAGEVPTQESKTSLKTADRIRAQAYEAQWRLHFVVLPKIREALKPLHAELHRRITELHKRNKERV